MNHSALKGFSKIICVLLFLKLFQTDLTDKLNVLEVKTDKNQQVITQMKEQQTKLKVSICSFFFGYLEHNDSDVR